MSLVHLFEEDQVFNFAPAPFPKDNDSWKDKFDIKRYNKKVWIYHNRKGEALYGITRHDFIDKEGNNNKFIFQFSYDANSKSYVKKNLWSQEAHLHDEHLMADSKFDTCVLPEGEKALDAGRKFFPQYFWTTFSGGVQNIDLVDDWKVLSAFKTLIIWPDNDKAGRESFLQLAQMLNDNLDCEVKIVDLPRTLPSKWDIGDKREDDRIDIYSMIHNAIPIDEYVAFNNLQRDIDNNRFVFVKSSGDGFLDRLTKELVYEKTLNNLYLRDKTINTKASVKLHKEACEVVDGFAFVPTTQEKVKVDNQIFLNKYKPVNFAPLSEDELDSLDEQMEFVLGHIFRLCNKDDFNYKHLLSTIASDVQYPSRNRKFCVLITSKQRYGKSFLFYLLEKLYGEANCESGVETEDFTDKYRDWMLNCNSVFCHEFSWNSREGKFMSKIKRLITETSHKVETKYKTKIKFHGSYNIWLASNDPVSISLNNDDGRFHIINIEETPQELLEEVDNPNYYKDLFKLLHDRNFLNKAYNYFKNYKIDYEIFNYNECPKSIAKEDTQDAGLYQWMKDLNELRNDKIEPFHRDLTCERLILEDLRSKENGKVNYGSRFYGVDEMSIRNYFHEINAKRINNGIQIALGNDPTRRKYWAINNQQFWKNCTDKRLMRLHMEGKYDPPPLFLHASKEAQKETKLNGGNDATIQPLRSTERQRG